MLGGGLFWLMGLNEVACRSLRCSVLEIASAVVISPPRIPCCVSGLDAERSLPSLSAVLMTVIW